MFIRKAVLKESDILLEIWLQTVRATHSFISEADIQAMLPHVREYLSAEKTAFWVVCDDSSKILGFMGLSGNKIESMFLDPAYHRRGIGRKLIQYAQSISDELTVDVNEQNHAACAFYESCGFVVKGRSELDEQGKPFPLLHMRLSNPLHLEPKPG